MSEFLKNLNEALAGKIYIESPLEEFGKHGKPIIFEGRIETLKQLVVTPYKVKEGPGIDIEYNENIKTEFTIEHVQKLVNLISEWSLKIKFIPLVLPSMLEKSYIERHKNIIGRYLEMYLPASDKIGKRWDFLIQKLD